LPPVGLTLFSVGEGGGVLDVVVDVGVWLPLVPHAAVVVPRVIRATPPATASMRRPIRFELIVNLLSVPAACR
jgi:hypothetical protein